VQCFNRYVQPDRNVRACLEDGLQPFANAVPTIYTRTLTVADAVPPYTCERWLQAVRKNRYVVLPKDIEKGYKSNVKKGDSEFAFYK
jgi:hypothetical protein